MRSTKRIPSYFGHVDFLHSQHDSCSSKKSNEGHLPQILPPKSSPHHLTIHKNNIQSKIKMKHYKRTNKKYHITKCPNIITQILRAEIVGTSMIIKNHCKKAF